MLLLPICPISSLSPVYFVLNFVLLFCFLCYLISCNPATPVVAQACSILSCIPVTPIVVQACSIPSCIPMTPMVVQACSTTSCIPATPVIAQDCCITSLDFQLSLYLFLQITVIMARARFSSFTHSFHTCIKTITISSYDQLSATVLGFDLPFKKWTALERRVNRPVVIYCTLSSWV